ncbi:MAG: hypothetical protein KKA73_16460 [Chloroflexi bacterium]|nr:hypothetical protein [Chloroflexota bacterium]MBU1749279.1 hypothetical protein [Chloroflexota bacterium]
MWFIGLVIYFIPSFVYAFWLAFQMAPTTTDYMSMSTRISQEIATIYSENWLLIGALMLIAALIILWRARAVAMGTGQSRWINGLVVGATAAVFSLVFVLCGGVDLSTVVTIVVYLGAGVVGGLLARA